MEEAINGSINIAQSQSFYRPGITVWNRLEGQPRTKNFERALKAEVRDPLWMLSKQWQLGEFKGEDAGSAVLAKVHIKTTRLTKYQAGENGTSPFDDVTPLETKVENQAIPFQISSQGNSQDISLNLRLLMGRHWLKLMKKNNLTLTDSHKTDYGFNVPDPSLAADVQICAHIEVWQQFAAVTKGSVDGYKIYSDFKGGVNKFAASASLIEKFIAWFEKLYYQPIDKPNPSWKPSQLEHQFACSAPQGRVEKVLIADEYYHGHLDWYNLDIHDQKRVLPDSGNGTETASVENTFTLSFLPAPVAFPGMPHNRWWTLEDWKTNLGNINPSTPDINQLMLLDFALNYANDWFMMPFTLPVGSIANVEGLMVTNVFGEKIWVEAAGRGRDEEWNRWAMFNLNVRGNMNVPADQSLLLLPTAPKILEGKPLEEVYLIRDEMANMVWGIESQVPLATGKSKAGKEAGRELREKYQQLAVPVPPLVLAENKAKIQYKIVNSVPENWLPFVPVHIPGDNRTIQLQRAAMPRILEGTESSVPAKVEPRTSILREGLDDGKPYFVSEEEVRSEGTKVYKSFQRTRWKNGKVFTWIGFRKQIGRGEGHSGLAFDQIIPKEVE